MKKSFKNILLAFSLAALVPAAVAAEGAAGKPDGVARPSAEARKARMEECKVNPEKCRAERQAKREQWCKEHPARCKEMAERREQRMAECKANPEKCRAEKKAHIEQRFKRADTDGDGRISRAEAEIAMPRLARHFDRIDANKDGQVTFDEIAAARKAFFEQRRGHRHGRSEPTKI